MTHGLDRAAASLAIFCELVIDVVRVVWGDIEKASREARPGRRPFHATSDEGIAFQRGLLQLTAAWCDYGPTDWLPWLTATRNAAAHRAPMTTWYMLKTPGGRGDGLLRPFAAQPLRSEIDAFRRGNQDARHPLGSLIIVKDSVDVLWGLINSLGSYLRFVVGELEGAWQTRKSHPTLVIQPGRQWKMETSTLEFAGYGATPRVQRDGPVHIAPDLAKRYSAARVMDADRHWWSDE